VKLELASIFESDCFGFEEDGAVSAEVAGGEVCDAAVDLSAGGNNDLSILKYVSGNAAAEGLTFFGEIARELVEEFYPNEGAFT
jgi:hypothetical protein